MADGLKLICFDLGGVVVRLKSGVAAELQAICPPHRQATLSAALRDDFTHEQTSFSLNEEYQRGLLTTENYLAKVLANFEGSISAAKLREKFLSVIAGEYAESVSLLAKLAKNYRLACYSNTHDLHWQHMLERFSWMRHFELPLASHLTGIAKPHADSFAAVCRTSKLLASECLFVDDRTVNIEGAVKYGMRAVHCTAPLKLADALRNAGVAGL